MRSTSGREFEAAINEYRPIPVAWAIGASGLDDPEDLVQGTFLRTVALIAVRDCGLRLLRTLISRHRWHSSNEWSLLTWSVTSSHFVRDSIDSPSAFIEAVTTPRE
jgi:hypothetical protein